MDNAQDFFGSTGINNGNGDGYISTSEHTLRWFEHLVAADLLVWDKTDTAGRPFISLIKNTIGIDLIYDGMFSKYSQRHVMRMFDYITSTTKIDTYFVYQLDKKIDDGMPNTGKMLSTGDSETCGVSNTDCCTDNLMMSDASFVASTLSGAKYNVQVTDHCKYMFVNLF